MPLASDTIWIWAIWASSERISSKRAEAARQLSRVEIPEALGLAAARRDGVVVRNQ